MAVAGPFERAYRRGVTERLDPPPSRPRGLPPAPFCLHGAVITPEESWSSGYVVVEGGVIAALQRGRPDGVDVLETDGVILPGLIDLHGHPDFNVFAAWEPPQLYGNRYQWRASGTYRSLIRDPQDTLLTTLPVGTELRYAQVRALAGGVTAIQGASGADHTDLLVRAVDLWIFGNHAARSMIDLPSPTTPPSGDEARLQKIVKDIGTGDVTAFYLHLCEGLRGDPRSAAELAAFLASGAATPVTNVIHGTALTEPDLHTLADAGCRMVWSPQSNLRLYGETTLAATALDAGIPVAIGADWLPTGSTSLLAELRVARRQLALQGHPVSAKQLVGMVTTVSAELAGLAGHLGAVAVGRPADLLVLERHHRDPYENVCLADPSWVELVAVGGDIAYAREDWFQRLSGPTPRPTTESLLAWGRTMRLDTGGPSTTDPSPPSLERLRALLTAAYPPVGPIYG